jgi:hypothetical protein
MSEVGPGHTFEHFDARCQYWRTYCWLISPLLLFNTPMVHAPSCKDTSIICEANLDWIRSDNRRNRGVWRARTGSHLIWPRSHQHQAGPEHGGFRKKHLEYVLKWSQMISNVHSTAAHFDIFWDGTILCRSLGIILLWLKTWVPVCNNETERCHFECWNRPIFGVFISEKVPSSWPRRFVKVPN